MHYAWKTTPVFMSFIPDWISKIHVGYYNTLCIACIIKFKIIKRNCAKEYMIEGEYDILSYCWFGKMSRYSIDGKL